MDLKTYLHMELDNLQRNIERVMKDLTPQEITWRPASGCNSIGLILYHIARSEDGLINNALQGNKEVWETEKWYQKLGLPVTDGGAHYTVDQVNAFQVPALKDIFAYWAAVRVQTLKYLDAFTPEAFDKKVTMRHFGETPVAAVLSMITGHASGHIGEMSYLRGLQRGMDK
jgi:hypothetical protein